MGLSVGPFCRQLGDEPTFGLEARRRYPAEHDQTLHWGLAESGEQGSLSSQRPTIELVDHERGRADFTCGPPMGHPCDVRGGVHLITRVGVGVGDVQEPSDERLAYAWFTCNQHGNGVPSPLFELPEDVEHTCVAGDERFEGTAWSCWKAHVAFT